MLNTRFVFHVCIENCTFTSKLLDEQHVFLHVLKTVLMLQVILTPALNCKKVEIAQKASASRKSMSFHFIMVDLTSKGDKSVSKFIGIMP